MLGFFCITNKYYLLIYKSILIPIEEKSRFSNLELDPKHFRVVNDLNSTCKLPPIDLIDHNTSLTESKCQIDIDWGYLKNKKWHITLKIKQSYPKVNCEYRPISRYNDFKIEEPTFMTPLEDDQLVESEVIEVNCRRGLNFPIEYTAVHVQIIDKLNKKKVKLNSKCEPLDIMLISFDSVSRVSWLQRLPKSNKFIFDKMEFKLLNGYNIVGDGTPGKTNRKQKIKL